MSADYRINYTPILNHRGELQGYDVEVTKRRARRDGFMQLEIEATKLEEYIRFQDMLKAYETNPGRAFIEKHPVDIVYYLRGKKRPFVRNPHWEEDIGSWRLDITGQRVHDVV